MQEVVCVFSDCERHRRCIARDMGSVNARRTVNTLVESISSDCRAYKRTATSSGAACIFVVSRRTSFMLCNARQYRLHNGARSATYLCGIDRCTTLLWPCSTVHAFNCSSSTVFDEFAEDPFAESKSLSNLRICSGTETSVEV